MKPIRCKHCGSTYVEFVSEYHRCLGARILRGIARIFMWYHAVSAFLFWQLLKPANVIGQIFTHLSEKDIENAATNAARSGLYALLIGALVLVLDLIILLKESKTHVKLICRDCGEIYRID